MGVGPPEGHRQLPGWRQIWALDVLAACPTFVRGDERHVFALRTLGVRHAT